MSDAVPDEKQFMEEKLDRALDEAWSKVNVALDRFSNSSEDPVKAIWLAAEAVEYASLLFNLTHGLEDLDPQVRTRRQEDPLILLKNSLEQLRRAREDRQKSVTQAYTSLRIAADNLKTVYLSRIKSAEKTPR